MKEHKITDFAQYQQTQLILMFLSCGSSTQLIYLIPVLFHKPKLHCRSDLDLHYCNYQYICKQKYLNFTFDIENFYTQLGLMCKSPEQVSELIVYLVCLLVLSFLIFTLIVTFLMDRVGRYVCVCIGLILSTLSLSGLMMTDNVHMCFLFMTLQGVGAGFLTPPCWAHALETVNKNKIHVAIGVLLSSQGFNLVIIGIIFSHWKNTSQFQFYAILRNVSAFILLIVFGNESLVQQEKKSMQPAQNALCGKIIDEYPSVEFRNQSRPRGDNNKSMISYYSFKSFSSSHRIFSWNFAKISITDIIDAIFIYQILIYSSVRFVTGKKYNFWQRTGLIQSLLEYGCCNLVTIAVSMFITTKSKFINFHIICASFCVFTLAFFTQIILYDKVSCEVFIYFLDLTQFIHSYKFFNIYEKQGLFQVGNGIGILFVGYLIGFIASVLTQFWFQSLFNQVSSLLAIVCLINSIQCFLQKVKYVEKYQNE